MSDWLALRFRVVVTALASLALAACGTSAATEHEGPVAATILLGGDLHFGENYERTKSGRLKVGPHTSQGRYRDSLKGLMPLIATADLTVANLETPLSPNLPGNPLAETRNFLHWADPKEAGRAIQYAGIDLLNLSNNHGMDQGEAGIEQTFAELRKSGTQFFGAGANRAEARSPYVYEFDRADGSKAAVAIFPGFSESVPPEDGFDPFAHEERSGIAPVDPEYMRGEIVRLRKSHPDLFVIAYPHWGHNYSWVYGDEVRLGQQLIDAGADMVVGHHAHTVQEIQRYRGKWILYGIGNFAFLSPGRFKQFDKVQPYAFAVELAFPADKSTPPRVRLFPIAANNQETGFQPHLVDMRQARQLISAIESREGSRGLSGSFGETDLGAYFQLDGPD